MAQTKVTKSVFVFSIIQNCIADTLRESESLGFEIFRLGPGLFNQQAQVQTAKSPDLKIKKLDRVSYLARVFVEIFATKVWSSLKWPSQP